MCNWFDLLSSHGPSFVYNPKSIVVVNVQWKSEAVAIFGDLRIQVVIGPRFRGGFFGMRCEMNEYVMYKVHKWMRHFKLQHSYSWCMVTTHMQ